MHIIEKPTIVVYSSKTIAFLKRERINLLLLLLFRWFSSSIIDLLAHESRQSQLQLVRISLLLFQPLIASSYFKRVCLHRKCRNISSISFIECFLASQHVVFILYLEKLVYKHKRSRNFGINIQSSSGEKLI